MAKKKFDEKDLYTNCYNTLRKRYPTGYGWIITAQDNYGTYIPDFVIEKKWGKKTFKVIVEVKKCSITKNDIDQLNKYVRNLAGPNVDVKAKIFIVASKADTTLVTDDFEVIYLKGYTCK